MLSTAVKVILVQQSCIIIAYLTLYLVYTIIDTIPYDTIAMPDK